MLNLKNAKRSYMTRNVLLSDAVSLAAIPPESGDLVLARVDRIRQHTRLENPEGRRVHLFPGDEIIIAAGERYATGQFHAVCPKTLGASHLVAAGGLAGNVLTRCSQVKPATEITLLGTLINQENDKLNLRDYGYLRSSYLHPATTGIPVLLVMGSDMSSGKTSLAASAINGFSALGLKVAGAKLTGTGSGPDYWKMLDAGAFQVRDFLDAGYPSTVGLTPQKLIDLLRVLKADAKQNHADLLVIEMADGVLQPDNQKLLQSQGLQQEVTGALLAADSASAAVLCCERIIGTGIPIYGLGGVLTRSELCCDEASNYLGLPIFKLDSLRDKSTARYLLNSLQQDNEHAAANVL